MVVLTRKTKKDDNDDHKVGSDDSIMDYEGTNNDNHANCDYSNCKRVKTLIKTKMTNTAKINSYARTTPRSTTSNRARPTKITTSSNTAMLTAKTPTTNMQTKTSVQHCYSNITKDATMQLRLKQRHIKGRKKEGEKRKKQGLLLIVEYHC